MASNPDPGRHRGKRPHDEMHATSAKAGPDLRCAPGWRRFASGFAEHRKIAETQRQTASRTSPHHIIGRCCANPIAAVVPAGHRQPHAFPIGRTQPPRLPPCEVFQRGPTQAQPPPSRRGPHRKTFTFAEVRSPCRIHAHDPLPPFKPPARNVLIGVGSTFHSRGRHRWHMRAKSGRSEHQVRATTPDRRHIRR